MLTLVEMECHYSNWQDSVKRCLKTFMKEIHSDFTKMRIFRKVLPVVGSIRISCIMSVLRETSVVTIYSDKLFITRQ